MKRYRILSFDFDTRVHSLVDEIRDEWEERVKQLHRENRTLVEEGLIAEYGAAWCEAKRQNFIDLGVKPFSVLAFHNRFFDQVRVSFVMGANYPALTGACALGERVLNHLVITLRDDFRGSPQFKSLYRKDSFDDWDLAIETLEAWDVLLPEVARDFRRLKGMRHKAIHFRPEVDQNDRELALQAIHCLGSVISNQFAAFGSQPWFITGTPGEMYIKKASESTPFVRRIYLPNCRLVGPQHYIETLRPRVVVNDDFEYDAREITDDEFRELRVNRREAK